MAPLLIYIVAPALLLLLYLHARRRMAAAKIEHPPQLDLLLLFLFYSPLVLAVLTIIFWEWSGMASIGTVTAMISGSFVLSLQAVRLYSRRDISAFHTGVWWASAVFIPVVALVEVLIALRYG